MLEKESESLIFVFQPPLSPSKKKKKKKNLIAC